MSKTRNVVQLVWGIALVLAGVGVFFRIPHVMPNVEMVEQFVDVILFIRAGFYLMVIFLVSGGAKKIFDYFKKVEDGNADT